MNEETLRSCSRCGAEFTTAANAHVCNDCRNHLRPGHRPRVFSKALTFRERSIVARLREGMPNKIIACDLHLSEGTVKVYISRIFRKLEVSNRTQAALWSIAQEKVNHP